MSSHLTELSALKESTHIDQNVVIGCQRWKINKVSTLNYLEKARVPETSQYWMIAQSPPETP